MVSASTLAPNRLGPFPSTLPALRRNVLWIAATLLSLPLFLLPRQGRPVKVKALHEMHPLAYVDGLRGYNAITIYTCHVMSRSWKWIPEGVTDIPWLQWPFRQGQSALLMFFWIGGYVSTYKLVSLMQTGQTERFLDHLTSMTFRRYFRLMLPILPVMFITTILVSAGIAYMPERVAADDPNKNVISNPLGYFIVDVGRVMDPFTKIVGYNDGGTGSKLLEHTWSLPAEFRSSMTVCLLCLATHKLSTKKRKTLILLAVPFFVYWRAAWAAMAWMGMWFAECRQERQRTKQNEQHSLTYNSTSQMGMISNSEDVITTEKPGSTKSQPRGQHFERYRKYALWILFLYSFVYLKNPFDITTRDTFPHNYVARLIPGHWHIVDKMQVHLFIGCMMLLYPLDRIQALQRPLLSPFSQFLGELSFGIYAMHIPVRWVVWEPLYLPYALKKCGAYSMDYFWCSFPGWFGMLVCVIWAAEGFRRLDMQVVKLLRVLEAKCFEK